MLGTFLSKNTSGLVYWGYSNNPLEKDSSFIDSLFRTPSMYLLTESANTIAGISPPVKT